MHATTLGLVVAAVFMKAPPRKLLNCNVFARQAQKALVFTHLSENPNERPKPCIAVFWTVSDAEIVVFPQFIEVDRTKIL